MGASGFTLNVSLLPKPPELDKESWEAIWSQIVDHLTAAIEDQLETDVEKEILEVAADELLEEVCERPKDKIDFLFRDSYALGKIAGSHWYRRAVIDEADFIAKQLKEAGLEPDFGPLEDEVDLTFLVTAGDRLFAVRSGTTVTDDENGDLTEVDEDELPPGLDGVQSCCCGLCA